MSRLTQLRKRRGHYTTNELHTDYNLHIFQAEGCSSLEEIKSLLAISPPLFERLQKRESRKSQTVMTQ